MLLILGEEVAGWAGTLDQLWGHMKPQAGSVFLLLALPSQGHLQV